MFLLAFVVLKIEFRALHMNIPDKYFIIIVIPVIIKYLVNSFPKPVSAVYLGLLSSVPNSKVVIFPLLLKLKNLRARV